MCAAHTCVRSAVAQAFRPPKCSTSTALSIPAFLVPALAHPPARPFSIARRRRIEAHPSKQDILGGLRHTPFSEYPSKPLKKNLPLRIPVPGPEHRHNLQPWLAAIDPFLPPQLRQIVAEQTEHISHADAIDFSWVLNRAQDASHDILSHIGLVEGRWDTVLWIVQKVVEGGSQVLQAPVQLEPFATAIWPDTELRSLQELTNSPLVLDRVRPSTAPRPSLNNLTSAPDSVVQKHNVVKHALGQVWRSLGNMILEATEESNKKESLVMPEVLEIIAYLHHAGLIPDSVYTYRPAQEEHALQQPPTLHLLSSKLLTALSDSTWRTNVASATVARGRMNASYFLGREIPGSRFRGHVTEIAPELWLELVLWSCLHGGWVTDGAVILRQLLSRPADPPWGLISWRELSQGEDEDSSTWHGWWGSGRKQVLAAQSEARERTRRTISSEVVTAFIDGLVNAMRVGVGSRGSDPRDLVEHIKDLKQLLDRSNLSLGSANWDSIMTRLIESGGIVPEKRPELLLAILELASGFGSEVSSANAPSQTTKSQAEPPYFFEPSTIPISLLHRTMKSFVENGDISGSMTTLNSLQQFTDSNKQKSLQQFFEALKAVKLRQDEPFTSRIPPIDFPAFDPHVPIPLLAKLLDLATETKLYDLGRWMLLSEELDGPLISRSMYDHPSMSAAIIRFGTVAGENDLVMQVVKRTGMWNAKNQSHHLPNELFTALLNSQVQLHRWESVQSMRRYVMEKPGYSPGPDLLANFAAELLRLSNDNGNAHQSQLVKAQSSFSDLLFEWENLILTRLNNHLYCILGIMSSVSDEWKAFCSKFLAFSTRQDMRLSTENFNTILGGVLEGFGSLKGKELVETWCHVSPKTFESYRAPGGLPAMPQFRVSKAEEYEGRPDDIEIVHPSGSKIVLRGRVHANRQTVWAILRKAQQEEEQRIKTGDDFTIARRVEVRDTLRWAIQVLYHLGFDYEDIIKDLGSFAKLAELEHPLQSPITDISEVDVEQNLYDKGNFSNRNIQYY